MEPAVSARTIEDIVLADDRRSMTALRRHLPADYVSDAARLLLSHPGPVLIVTGFFVREAGAAETDGPPGAAALGSALQALGREVAYVTDRFSKRVVEAVVGGRAIEFPVAGHEESKIRAAELLAERRPSVLVAVERAGLASDGTYRNHAGADFSDCNAKTDYLFTQHPLSIGIGDGGNEVGMGLLRELASPLHRLAVEPSVTATTRLVVASCSNWGAYGLVAALSMLTGRQLLPTVEQGYLWVRLAVAAGAVEGFTGAPKDWVDGRSPEEDARCLRDLHVLLARA